MIIRVNTSEASRLNNLFGYLQKEQVYYRFVANEQLLVAPKAKKIKEIEAFEEVIEIIDIETPYHLASKKFKSTTSFDVNGVIMGNHEFNIIAGPCSVESEDHIYQTAAFLQKVGVKFIRGGAYKPRTSPYSFMGLGKKGLQYLQAAAKKYDLRVVTEIMDLSLLEEVCEYSDILQVGSRSMQNFYMLNELGKIQKPILLKRGMNAKVTEWLLAAEYILSGGNNKVILCERGIRSFDPESRNVMDIGVIPLLKELSHLPIIADPSHGTGAALRVEAMTIASAAAGCNGLLIEIHPEPKKALSDGAQALSFEQFELLLKRLSTFLNAFHKTSDLDASILKLQTL